jgi:hypothetical protein
MSALRPFPSMGTMDALPPGRVFAQKECTPTILWPADGEGMGGLNPIPSPEIESTGGRRR